MAVREYVGARYVPKFDGDWDNTKTYEPLTIVSVANVGSYTSKKYVPVGVPITDTDYWVLTANVSGQMIQLQNEIDAINDTIKTPELFGAAGDGITDDTAAINSALAGGGVVVFKPGASYLVDPDVSLLVDNDSYIDLNGATILAKAVSSDYYEIFYIKHKKNVVICNGIIIGDRDSHTGTTGEWGMGIYVGGSENVLIDNMDISKCWGDGVYIGDTAEYDLTPSKNVKVVNCTIKTCRRQGISVVWCDDVIISNNSIHDISGTAPEACIDVEPNASQAVNNVIIADNIFKTAKKGVTVYGGPSNFAISNVTIDNNIFKVSSGGTAAILNSHNIKFSNNDISGTAGLMLAIGTENISVIGNKLHNITCNSVLYISDAKNTFISANDINDVAAASDCLYFLSSENVTFSGNHVGDVTVTGNNLFYFNAPAGYTCDKNVVKDNTFENISCSGTGNFIQFRMNTSYNKIINNFVNGVYNHIVSAAAASCLEDDVFCNVLSSSVTSPNFVGTGSGGNYGVNGNVNSNFIDRVLIP